LESVLHEEATMSTVCDTLLDPLPRVCPEKPSYQPTLTACYKPSTGKRSHQWRQACIWDVSSYSVSLILAQRLEEGTYLNLRLSSTDPAFEMTGLVRVIHTHPEPGGVWLHVCVIGQDFGPEPIRGAANFESN
jgi:hypothetical protein